MVLTRSEALEILGLGPEASVEDARKAFRELSKTYHPDKNRAANAAVMFHIISQAWDTIRRQHAEKEASEDTKSESWGTTHREYTDEKGYQEAGSDEQDTYRQEYAKAKAWHQAETEARREAAAEAQYEAELRAETRRIEDKETEKKIRRACYRICVILGIVIFIIVGTWFMVDLAKNTITSTSRDILGKYRKMTLRELLTDEEREEFLGLRHKGYLPDLLVPRFHEQFVRELENAEMKSNLDNVNSAMQYGGPGGLAYSLLNRVRPSGESIRKNAFKNAYEGLWDHNRPALRSIFADLGSLERSVYVTSEGEIAELKVPSSLADALVGVGTGIVQAFTEKENISLENVPFGNTIAGKVVERFLHKHIWTAFFFFYLYLWFYLYILL